MFFTNGYNKICIRYITIFSSHFGLLMFIIESRIPPFSVTPDLFLITLYNYVLLQCVYREYEINIIIHKNYLWILLQR